MVRRLGEVLQTIGGYGFHIYDDGGARWITIRYETEDAARKARDLIAKALAGAISVSAWLAFSRSRLETCNNRCSGKGRCKQFVIKSPR
jgi:hypothetical protein